MKKQALILGLTAVFFAFVFTWIGESILGWLNFRIPFHILTMAMLFMAPVFYPVTALPEDLRPLLYWNPLTSPIEEMRAVLFWGRLPDYGQLAVDTLVAAVVAWLGFAWFQKTRKGFADVL